MRALCSIELVGGAWRECACGKGMRLLACGRRSADAGWLPGRLLGWQALAAAYRSGYEGTNARPQDSSRRGGDGDVVDDAVEGDPRAQRGWARESERGAEVESDRGWEEGRRDDRMEREGSRGAPGLEERQGQGRGARWEGRDDDDRGRGQDRGREGEAKDREREEDDRRGRGEGGERQARGERDDGGDRGGEEWHGRGQGGRGSERQVPSARGNVPTDEYRRMREAHTEERLDHDLARDTGRGPFKRMKKTLKGMGKARPSDARPEPPKYKESDDWNHFWG